jgi:hypothetical protein
MPRFNMTATSIGLALALLVGCSGDDDGSSSSGTTETTPYGGMGGIPVSMGGMGGAAGGAGGMGGTVCVAHDNVAPEVELNRVAMAMPAPIGGPIAGGTFFLTDWTQYTGPGGEVGPTGQKWKETQVWSVTDLQTALDIYDGSGERKIKFAYDLGAGQGEGLTFQVICPSPLAVPWDSYTAPAHETLTLFNKMLGMAWTYTLQP